MDLKIKQIENGYLLTYGIETEHNVYKIYQVCVEELDDDNDTMIKLLHEVAKQFGNTYDKWSYHNLGINFNQKGHKVE